jgi:hypothetical protein
MNISWLVFHKEKCVRIGESVSMYVYERERERERERDSGRERDTHRDSERERERERGKERERKRHVLLQFFPDDVRCLFNTHSSRSIMVVSTGEDSPESLVIRSNRGKSCKWLHHRDDPRVCVVGHLLHSHVGI